MSQFEHTISQSLIKKFLHKGNELEYCPRKIYHTEIVKDIPRHVSDEMQAGRFFETLCIGSSINGEMLTDLPRKKLTKLQIAQNDKAIRENKKPPNIARKNIGQERLEQQALVFKQLCVKYQIAIHPGLNTQVNIKKVWEEDPAIQLDMTLDVFPTPIMLQSGLRLAILDPKVTGDIHNTFGNYCYGDPDNLDKIQGWMYHYGVRDIDFALNPHLEDIVTPKVTSLINDNEIHFLFWVFNFKKDELENKPINVRWNENARNDLFESIRKTVAIIEFNEDAGWPTRPEFSFCSKCLVKDCVDRSVMETV